MINTDSFFEVMTEILEEEVNSLEFELNEDNWSSIAVVSCLAEFDDLFDKLLDGDELSNCKTASEVYDMLINS